MPPAKVTIIIDTTGKDNGYNRANDMLKEYYDRSPTSLIDIPISPEDQADQAYYRALAEQIAKNAPPSSVPIGKRVV